MRLVDGMFSHLEYIDLYGTDTIGKLVFIDEAPSIYCHRDWTEEERLKAGAFTTSAEAMISMFYRKGLSNRLVVNTDVFDFYTVKGAPAFENSHLSVLPDQCLTPAWPTPYRYCPLPVAHSGSLLIFPTRSSFRRLLFSVPCCRRVWLFPIISSCTSP